jgi:hypothetical protein
MILGLLSVTAIVFLLWLLFAFATYALPFWAGLGAAMLAHSTGAGTLVSVVVGIVAAGLVIGFSEALFARLRSPVARAALVMLFAAPAALATYFAARGVLSLSVDSAGWLVGLSIAASFAAGFIAWYRLVAGAHLPDDREERGTPAEVPPRAPVNRSGPATWPARPRRR